jgi:hypothetical protein
MPEEIYMASQVEIYCLRMAAISKAGGAGHTSD